MEITADDVKILPLGGCLLQAPLMTHNRRLYVNTRKIVGRFSYPPLYSFSEIFQFIRAVRGEISVPEPIKQLAGFNKDFQPNPSIGDFADMDAVLLEPNTPTDIVYGDYTLNRTAILMKILLPIRAAHPDLETAKMTNHWLTKGLLGNDEAAQKALAKTLVGLMPKTLPFFDILCDVLMSARTRQQDVADGLRVLRSMIDRPTGVLTFTFQFMPDGRPVSWPAGFQDEVLSTANALALPVFEPGRLVEKLVEQHGAAKVLMPDLRHYSDDFMPVVGRAIADFAATVARSDSHWATRRMGAP
jgi:hypothetical protein